MCCKVYFFPRGLFLALIEAFGFVLTSVEACKETEKSSEKGDAYSPQAKSEDKENKPSMNP